MDIFFIINKQEKGNKKTTATSVPKQGKTAWFKGNCARGGHL